MARYIDADKLKPKTERWLEMDDYDHEREYCMSYYPLSEIENAPTEDVKPIVRGKCSITHGMYENRIWCNNCGFIKVITGEEENYNFCPKCGAIAESEEE